MTRGIQNIDLDSVVLKTHDRSRHRNTTLTFDLHKVGRGCLLDLIRFNSSGNVNGSAVEKEFFRQSGFSGIRVTDDSESTASFNFFFKSHNYFFECAKIVSIFLLSFLT